MSWKSRQLPTLIENIVVKQQKPPSTMIEHSINRYSVVIPTYKPPDTSIRPAWMDNPRATTVFGQKWSKKQCEEYKESLMKKGFILGAKVTTKYGVPGIISEFREIPEIGIDFNGYATPNMFLLKREGMMISHLLYNEEELILDLPPVEEVTC